MRERSTVERIVTLLGIEKRCTSCKEFWPEDSEFFFFHHFDGCYYAECRACYAERRRKQYAKVKAAKAANIQYGGMI